jgi:hypothetical protein
LPKLSSVEARKGDGDLRTLFRGGLQGLRSARGEATFSFYAVVPDELRHSYYCSSCQATVFAPALERYQELMERAREAYFFFCTQRKAVPVLKREREPLRVDRCPDRDETILRLAFKAVELGSNAVIEAEVVSEKVRNEGYQKSAWKGVGFAAVVDAERLERQNQD